MAMSVADGEDTQVLYGNFNFFVQFVDGDPAFAPRGKVSEAVLGGFSEVSGLEASMEHKVVRQAGVNYGARMLTGPVNFGTVILKRGVARSQTLWRWWSLFAGGDNAADARPIPADRCDALIVVRALAPPTHEMTPQTRATARVWRPTTSPPSE
jgi:phage tail-like protein